MLDKEDSVYFAMNEDIDAKDEIENLDETLCWLEDNVKNEIDEFFESCRRKFEELVN